jgi:tyrosyl-tRNA synthetase
VHGVDECRVAEDVKAFLIGKSTVAQAEGKSLDALRKEIPHVIAKPGDSIIDALEQSGLAASKSEARRLLAGNAVAINGTKVSRETFEADDFKNGRLLLRKGKAFKDSALVEQN